MTGTVHQLRPSTATSGPREAFLRMHAQGEELPPTILRWLGIDPPPPARTEKNGPPLDHHRAGLEGATA